VSFQPDTGRCFGDGDPQMAAYHDDEWGRPVRDEAGLFERLCLEAMQSGLSWAIVLRKRDGMREAFAGFAPDAVARFGDADVQRLLGDVRVIRNRRKIEAVVTNARATLALREQGRPLQELVWSFRPEPGPAPATLADVPAFTGESRALAKELKRAGFVFVGPTTIYAAMQATGLVNDHVAGCPVRTDAAAAAARPL
jgi:DNA-3-methyladenine glycosylase I